LRPYAAAIAAGVIREHARNSPTDYRGPVRLMQVQGNDEIRVHLRRIAALACGHLGGKNIFDVMDIADMIRVGEVGVVDLVDCQERRPGEWAWMFRALAA